jgi:hypothetical protein
VGERLIAAGIFPADYGRKRADRSAGAPRYVNEDN